jgi:hypothetical protein
MKLSNNANKSMILSKICQFFIENLLEKCIIQFISKKAIYDVTKIVTICQKFVNIQNKLVFTKDLNLLQLKNITNNQAVR